MRHHLALEFFVAARLGCLALERVYLPAHFFQNVEHARQVLLGAFQLRFRQALLGLEFADSGSLFDDGAPILRPVAQNLADASLFDDRVAFRT